MPDPVANVSAAGRTINRVKSSDPDARTAKTESRELLDTATIQAGRVIADAKKRAEEIAGSAYEAIRESLAVEKALEDNPVMQDAWINRQLELEAVNQYLAEDDSTTTAE